jgi:hypothetical protein
VKRWYNTVRADGTLYKRDLYEKVVDVVRIDYPGAVRYSSLNMLERYNAETFTVNGRQVACIWITEN